MRIDDLITSITEDPKKRGTNKKCFLLGDYVLLYGSFKETEMKCLMDRTQALAGQGIAVVPTLEYRVDIPSNALGYARGWMLQPKARGAELYRRGMDEAEYADRLREIAEMAPEQTDRFAADWMAITRAGLRIDPSRCENFFYKNGRIEFIDLNLPKRSVEPKMSFAEATNVLMGLGLKSPKYGDVLARIVKNVSRSFLKQGVAANDIRDVVSGYDYLLGEERVVSIIRDLTPAKTQNVWQPHRDIGGR